MKATDTEEEMALDAIFRKASDETTPYDVERMHSRVMAEISSVPAASGAQVLGLFAVAAAMVICSVYLLSAPTQPAPEPSATHLRALEFAAADLPGAVAPERVYEDLRSAVRAPYETQLESLESDLLRTVDFLNRALPL